MIFTELPLRGAYLIACEEQRDERGTFARLYCREEFARHGVDFAIRQASLSTNRERGTLRGLHYQRHPNQEIKLVSCLRGAIFDCVVDLREDSPTYLRHVAVELRELGAMMLVPKDFAHGFQTLTDNAVVQYHMSADYIAEAQGGLRWDDPALGIVWPECERRIISDRDQSHPLLGERV